MLLFFPSAEINRTANQCGNPHNNHRNIRICIQHIQNLPPRRAGGGSGRHQNRIPHKAPGKSQDQERNHLHPGHAGRYRYQTSDNRYARQKKNSAFPLVVKPALRVVYIPPFQNEGVFQLFLPANFSGHPSVSDGRHNKESRLRTPSLPWMPQ